MFRVSCSGSCSVADYCIHYRREAAAPVSLCGSGKITAFRASRESTAFLHRTLHDGRSCVATRVRGVRRTYIQYIYPILLQKGPFLHRRWQPPPAATPGPLDPMYAAAPLRCVPTYSILYRYPYSILLQKGPFLHRRWQRCGMRIMWRFRG